MRISVFMIYREFPNQKKRKLVSEDNINKDITSYMMRYFPENLRFKD